MLTQKQQDYIAKIPETTLAIVNSWDQKAAAYAKKLVRHIESKGLEVFWEGSLALGIAGENDIDLYIFSKPKDFNKHLSDIVLILGEPTYNLSEKVLWRIKKDGYKIDASLAAKDSSDVKMDMLFFNTLKSSPELLN